MEKLSCVQLLAKLEWSLTEKVNSNGGSWRKETKGELESEGRPPHQNPFKGRKHGDFAFQLMMSDDKMSPE